MPKGRRNGCLSSSRLAPLTAFSLVRRSVMGRCPPGLMGALFFTESMISSAHLSRGKSTDTPENNFLPAIWSFLSPVKWTHEINHHSL